ncbi:MAG: NAD(P)H-hydrate epimerase [Balneolaceae bacterium]|nr:NAD(P)H-hydrate epimerase [Balneolaceae bacterium]
MPAQKLLAKVKPGEKGLFFCGKGNNAGDALVVARYLVQHGINCILVFISGIDELSENTQKNFNLLSDIMEKDEKRGTVTIHKSWEAFDPDTKADFIVSTECLERYSIQTVRGDYSKAIRWINSTSPETRVYAIDIPTGLHGDSGIVMGRLCIGRYHL